MNCPACQRHLTAYIDDEVSAELRHEIETHLDGCQECRGEFETHQTALEAASSIGTGSPRRDLWQGIADQLEPGGTTVEDMALMIRGLARQVESLEQTVNGLRRDLSEEEEQEEVQSWSRTDIRVRSKPVPAGKMRPASIPATIDQLRRSS